MRSPLSMIAGAAIVVGFTGTLAHELRNPGEVRAELAASNPVPTVATSRAVRAVAPKAEVTAASAGAARAEAALAVLSSEVVEQSHPDALRRAMLAYYNYKAAHPEKVKKPYFYFVDYGLDSRVKRGYVFDMEKLTVVDGPFTVAHGRGSSSARDGVPTRFSNRNGSNATSLGLYLAQETYTFSGKSGGRAYRSVGLRLRGLSDRFNSAARARGVVVHGAPYVTAQKAGRSEGCPAMEQSRAQRLLPKIANGGLVFHFSPRDNAWMAGDPWVEGSAKLALKASATTEG